MDNAKCKVCSSNRDPSTGAVGATRFDSGQPLSEGASCVAHSTPVREAGYQLGKRQPGPLQAHQVNSNKRRILDVFCFQSSANKASATMFETSSLFAVVDCSIVVTDIKGRQPGKSNRRLPSQRASR